MLTTLSGRILFGVGLITIALLQSKLWLGEGGYQQSQELQQLIDRQETVNTQLAERNRVLRAEVNDLKEGLEAVEEHARLDLGLIKPNETFVQMSTLGTNAPRVTAPTINSDLQDDPP
jgi:cell division protein FtsB